MAINLDVPVVHQDKDNSCWYASACMLAWADNNQGPRLGSPTDYAKADSEGISPDQFYKMAIREGLRGVAGSDRKWTPLQLERILMDLGALWCAGYWYGAGHIIVLRGIDHNNDLIFNDPDPGMISPYTKTIAWFNEHLAKDIPEPLMYKPRN